MKCPFCSHGETQVKDSRPSEDHTAIRRRRSCPECGARFTTFERVEMREIYVVKSSGQREPFDREKVRRSLKIALRKRPIDEERLEKMASSILRQIERLGETDVSSRKVGEIIMEILAEVDQVAYVRFASVYRDFREAKDFEAFIEQLPEAADDKP